jgi:hypothetical protein
MSVWQKWSQTLSSSGELYPRTEHVSLLRSIGFKSRLGTPVFLTLYPSPYRKKSRFYIVISHHLFLQHSFQLIVYHLARRCMAVIVDIASLNNPRRIVIFQALTATSMKLTAFWDIAPCSHRPDDGGSKHLRNVDQLLRNYTAQQPRRQSSSANSPSTNNFHVVS